MKCDICGTEIKVGESIDVLMIRVVKGEKGAYHKTDNSSRRYVHHACNSVGAAAGTPGARTEGK